MYEDDDSVFAAMRAGARGYLLKGAEQDDVLRAISAVAAGEAIFGPAIAERLMAYFAAGSVAAHPFPELTERERDVVELIARGKSNAAIAAELSLTLKTVQNHVSNVFTKLRVTDRSGAVDQGARGRAGPRAELTTPRARRCSHRGRDGAEHAGARDAPRRGPRHSREASRELADSPPFASHRVEQVPQRALGVEVRPWPLHADPALRLRTPL
jgi:Response regulator containing a CheY-like receiver domain and an HTH DNA-binding domain